MSKQRLCRGKQVANEEWIHGWYYEADGKSFIFYDTGKTYPDGNLYASSEVIPSSVAQSTGREDCNGHEIYDGDKIKSCTSKRVLHIFWSDKKCAFRAADEGGGNVNALHHWNTKTFELLQEKQT